MLTHGGRGVTATRWSVTPQSTGSTPSDRPNALVAQWIAHRFPGPEVAGSSPAKGAHTNPCSSTERVSVYEAEDGSSILSRGTDETRGPRGPTGRGGRLNAGSVRVPSRPAHHTGNRRISSTGESTCLVNRWRGFESCIRLHSAPIDDGGRATCFASVAQRTERRVSTSRGAGSNPAGGSRDATTAVPERQPRGFARACPIAFPADGDGPFCADRIHRLGDAVRVAVSDPT